MKINKLLLASAVSMALAACGGGGGSGGDSNSGTTTPPVTAPQSVVFSGSAAVGAPLAGTVTVKDSKGAVKTATIGANGAYSVDVTGMTGPFVFRATGTANGQTYTVHSIATGADAAGKINITQLTDLVAANVGGQLASDFFDQFDKNSNAANATPAAIDAEVAKLKEKLQPVLTALGVDANTDLLRTPFTPLSSPLDKALDAIHVTVDSSTAVATISTIANTAVITDDLKQKAAAETAPAKLTADNISTAATDAPLVKKALTDFIGQFANGLPTISALQALATTGFLNDDESAQSFFSYLVKQTVLVGATFTDIEIRQIDYSDPNKITAHVSFNVRSKDGVVLDHMANWKVRKTDGGWRVHGNQRALSVQLFPEMAKYVSASGTCYRSGFNIYIRDYNGTNTTTSGTLDHVLLTGPGLPQAGLLYKKASDGSFGRTDGLDSNYLLGSDCTGASPALGDDAVARIPDNASYVVTAYDAANNKLSFASGTNDGTYTIKTPRRPMTLTETKASSAFVTFSDKTLAALSTFTSGTLSVSGGNANPGADVWLLLSESVGQYSPYQAEATVIPSAAGAFSTDMMLTIPSYAVIVSNGLRAESYDQYRRSMVTVYNSKR